VLQAQQEQMVLTELQDLRDLKVLLAQQDRKVRKAMPLNTVTLLRLN